MASGASDAARGGEFVYRLRSAHGTVLAYERATGLVVSCATAQFGPEFSPVLAFRSSVQPHACFLFPAGARDDRIYMDRGPWPAPIIALRVTRSPDDPLRISLSSPHTGLFACAAPPGEAGEPRWVSLVREVRAEYEWFTCEPDPTGSPAPEGLAQLLPPRMNGPAILALMGSDIPPKHRAAFLSIASLLHDDQAQWLASIILTHPPALANLQLVAEADVWAQLAMPALQTSLQGAKLPRARRIGRELDDLAVGGLNGHPASFAHRCNALARTTVAARRTLAIVATARNEGLYLLEWIAYHRLIGAEHIFIYSNDNDDGSDDLLRILAQNEVITWVDSELAPGGSAQPKAYGHAFGLLPDILDYRWSLVIDLDEFFGFDRKRFRSALDYIGWQETQGLDTIALDWLVFGSDGRERWSDAPLVSRFVHRLPWVDMHVKSLSRTNLCMQSHPHVPVLTRPGPARIGDEAGRPFTAGQVPSFNAHPTADLAWVAHYWLKSTEEFAWKNARNRGDHALVKQINPGLIKDDAAKFFLDQHGTGITVPDRRMTLCAPGLEEEIRRLRVLPGVKAALAEILTRFRLSVAEIRTRLQASSSDALGKPSVAALSRLLAESGAERQTQAR